MNVVRSIVRLSVNLAPDVADALLYHARRKGISITEAIRRSIACLNFIYKEQAKGNRFVTIETRRGREYIREIIINE